MSKKKERRIYYILAYERPSGDVEYLMVPSEIAWPTARLLAADTKWGNVHLIGERGTAYLFPDGSGMVKWKGAQSEPFSDPKITVML